MLDRQPPGDTSANTVLVQLSEFDYVALCELAKVDNSSTDEFVRRLVRRHLMAPHRERLLPPELLRELEEAFG